MAPLDQVDHFITTPYYRPPFSAAAAGEHPRRPRGPVDYPGEPQEGVRTASRSSDRRAASFDVGERMSHALDGGEAKNTGSGRSLA